VLAAIVDLILLDGTTEEHLVRYFAATMPFANEHG